MSDGKFRRIVEANGCGDLLAKMQKINEYKPNKGSLRIDEYSFINKPILGEDGEENNQDPNNPQVQQPSANNPTDVPTQGGNMPPQNNGEQQPMPQPQDNMPAQPGEGGEQVDMTAMSAGPVDGVGTDVETVNTEVDVNTDTMQPGDEVVSVDDLTKAQTDTENKVNAMDTKIDAMIASVQNVLNILDQNDNKIEDLRAELERRNPTPEEKLNIRSQTGGPFNQDIKGYWNQKTADPNNNYDVSFNNDSPVEKERKFDIYASDIDNFDIRKVADSLDNMPELKDYINYF